MRTASERQEDSRAHVALPEAGAAEREDAAAVAHGGARARGDEVEASAFQAQPEPVRQRPLEPEAEPDGEEGVGVAAVAPGRVAVRSQVEHAEEPEAPFSRRLLLDP